MFSADGSTVGVVMDSTSDEEVAKLDALLSQLADLRMVNITATVEKEKRREGEVATTEAPPTWGSSVAGVSYSGFVHHGCPVLVLIYVCTIYV